MGRFGAGDAASFPYVARGVNYKDLSTNDGDFLYSSGSKLLANTIAINGSQFRLHPNIDELIVQSFTPSQNQKTP